MVMGEAKRVIFMTDLAPHPGMSQAVMMIVSFLSSFFYERCFTKAPVSSKAAHALLYQFFWAAITKDRKLTDLTEICLLSFETQKSKTKVSGSQVPSGAFLLGLYMAVFSLCLHIVLILPIVCIQLSSQKDISHMGLEPILIISF